MIQLRCIVLVLTLAIAGVPAGRAQQAAPVGEATMSGEVRDVQTGEPIPGVVVAIPDLERVTVTDQWGAFVLERLPVGTYRWIFRRLGYARWEGDSEVTDGDLFTVRLLPQPEVLAGLTVVADGFEVRRRRVSASVVALDEADIAASGATNAHQVFISRSRMDVVSCGGEAFACVRWRGDVLRPAIYVDDEVFTGGLSQLAIFGPAEIHQMEVLRWPGGVRVYLSTRAYAERLARAGRRPPAFAHPGGLRRAVGAFQPAEQ